jgi:hypothetical protein
MRILLSFDKYVRVWNTNRTTFPVLEVIINHQTSQSLGMSGVAKFDLKANY